MVSKTRLYDAFGELLYSVAISDGMVQPEEQKVLEEMLQDHPWGKEIQWSFNYEMKKSHRLKDTYQKAIETLKENGPDEDYAYLVEILRNLAKANEGIDRTEGRIISNFQHSLLAHFREFLDENGLIRKR